MSLRLFQTLPSTVKNLHEIAIIWQVPSPLTQISFFLGTSFGIILKKFAYSLSVVYALSLALTLCLPSDTSRGTRSRQKYRNFVYFRCYETSVFVRAKFPISYFSCPKPKREKAKIVVCLATGVTRREVLYGRGVRVLHFRWNSVVRWSFRGFSIGCDSRRKKKWQKQRKARKVVRSVWEFGARRCALCVSALSRNVKNKAILNGKYLINEQLFRLSLHGKRSKQWFPLACNGLGSDSMP